MSVDRNDRTRLRHVNPLGVPLAVPVIEQQPVQAVEVRRFECAEQCGAWAESNDRRKRPHHPCENHGGAMLPLVPIGTKARYVPVPREDYANRDLVQPIRDRRAGSLLMAVDTVRDDGFDRTVFAATATAEIEEARDARESAHGE